MGRKAKQGTFPLRLLREERDISLSEMVQKIGYTKGYISAVETGTSRATPAFLAAYERALNLTTGSLQAGEDQTTRINDVLSTVSAGFERDAPPEAPAPSAPAPSGPPSNNGVLEGVQAVILQAIALVTAAASQPPLPGAEIIITFQSQDDPLTIYPDLARQWRQALRQAMAAGWNIVHL
ncbi:MAG TPA: helix-turn-helix transcriptional regulator, partial [Herpetosiphonaceae bacterium]|nr:helix-turn-helix transcriptional regulator [Herpetosiphonaceae bacterium]